MKFIYSILFIALFSFVSFSQTPQGINYQGVARNSSGVELANQTIGIRFSVLNTSASGTAVYTETHNTTTDANGLFALMIGTGTPTSGTFAGIDWANGGSKWLEVSMDISGGSSYVLMGTSQLLSVPYALYAGKVANNGGKSILILSDSVTNAEAAAIIAAEVGPNTNEIIIADCVNLTSIDLSSVTNVKSILITNNPVLSSLNLNGLKRCFWEINISNCPQLTAANFPSLKTVGDGMRIENTGVGTISAPVLANYSGDLQITSNANLTAVSFPLITQCGDILINVAPNLTSINMNSLVTATSFGVHTCTSLTSLSLPSLLGASSVYVFSAPLTSIALPLLASVTGSFSMNYTDLTSIAVPNLNTLTGSVSVAFNKLTVSEVDNWLGITANLVMMAPGSINYVSTAGQTPPAPPSVTGQTFVGMLQSQGTIVQTD